MISIQTYPNQIHVASVVCLPESIKNLDMTDSSQGQTKEEKRWRQRATVEGKNDFIGLP